ncbi:glycosyltransferase family 2 protein [uncultured Lacinutrix sp.]|uniref:glycosyltransferase family 2 protein n=1 Tax=uncultured Lacinutrix sp. TaxID=574032 RepID=UPI00261A0DC7|nr:glycosyltransferase family 2 protein [uncultured Lacinutrix sp.]
MKRALVSIIIPVYNRVSIVKMTLDSIIKQSYINWECIIVDDGSTDQTSQTIENYIKKDNRIKLCKRPANLIKGANSCRNHGFTLAKGIYINWFDSDDIMKSNFIEEKVNSFQDNLDAVVHRNNYANYSLSKFRDSKYTYNNGESLFYNYAMENIEIQTCGFMWKRSFLENKTLFDENILRYQDNEFHIRMLADKNLKVRFLNKVLATIRSGDGHESQISSKTSLTKQKLYDVFYYRYQCHKLAIDNNIDVDDEFNEKISKKALWAFYAALRFEKKMNLRISDFNKYSNKIKSIHNNPQIVLKDKLKSKLYIYKTILFR